MIKQFSNCHENMWLVWLIPTLNIHFPDTRPGSVVAVLRANDIDLSPAVTYRLDRPSDYFSLDTYTGQLILLKGPEEKEEEDQDDMGGLRQMTLSAVASDSVHEARTQVEVSQ